MQQQVNKVVENQMKQISIVEENLGHKEEKLNQITENVNQLRELLKWKDEIIQSKLRLVYSGGAAPVPPVNVLLICFEL